MKLQKQVALKARNTLALPAMANALVEISNVSELAELSALINEQPQPFMILGGGSNVVFQDDYHGLVIDLQLQGKELIGEDAQHYYLKVAAGETWHDLVTYCLEQGYYGIENLALIPGRVGAAPIQNIGAYGVELKQCFYQLEAINLANGYLKTDHFKTMSLTDCEFGYRDSVFKRQLRDQLVITSVTLKLNKQDHPNTSYQVLADVLAAAGLENPTAQQVYQAVIDLRRSKLPDPAVLPNAGSFFKNPVVDAEKFAALKAQYPDLVAYPEPEGRAKLAAGWLLQQDGWRGYRAGSVGVHEQQSLVLVNYGGATGKELLALAADITGSILERFGIQLEIEPRVY